MMIIVIIIILILLIFVVTNNITFTIINHYYWRFVEIFDDRTWIYSCVCGITSLFNQSFLFNFLSIFWWLSGFIAICIYFERRYSAFNIEFDYAWSGIYVYSLSIQ